MQTNNPNTVPIALKKSSIIASWFMVENIEADQATIKLQEAGIQNNSEKVDIIEKFLNHKKKNIEKMRTIVENPANQFAFGKDPIFEVPIDVLTNPYKNEYIKVTTTSDTTNTPDDDNNKQYTTADTDKENTVNNKKNHNPKIITNPENFLTLSTANGDKK